MTISNATREPELWQGFEDWELYSVAEIDGRQCVLFHGKPIRAFKGDDARREAFGYAMALIEGRLQLQTLRVGR